MRVLYVEDNDTNQALVGRVMRARHHAVLFREDAEEALAVLAEDPTIDLILMDVELAGTMSGMDAVKILRERGDTRPVVAVTAYAMMGDRERALEAGCDQYLPKPIVVPDLLALLDHYAAPSGAVAPLPDKLSEAAPDAPAAAAPTVLPAPPDSPPPAPAESPAAPAQMTPSPPAISEVKRGTNGAKPPEPLEKPLAEAPGAHPS